MNKRNVIAFAAGLAANATLKFATGVVVAKSLGAWTGADMKAKTITKAYRNVPVTKAVAANALVIPFIVFGYLVADMVASSVVDKTESYLGEKEIA